MLDGALEKALEDQEKKFLISYQNHVQSIMGDIELLKKETREDKFEQMKIDKIA